MTDYNVLEKLTTNFYMVSVDELNNSFGGSSLLPTLDDCDAFIKAAEEDAIEKNSPYLVTVYEYIIDEDVIQSMNYDIQIFFDHMDKYDGTIVDSLIVGKR